MWVESIPAALQSFELMLHSHVNVSFSPSFSISHTWSAPHMFLFVETFCNFVGSIFPLQSFCPGFFLPPRPTAHAQQRLWHWAIPSPLPSFLSRGWFRLSRLFIYLFTSLTLECHFAIIAFDLVIISPRWSVGPVSPRPTVFRTFLSLPFYDFIAHHCAVFFMFILLGIYQAREICRFVGFVFFKIKSRKILAIVLRRCFCFIRIPASWDPSHTNGRPLQALCRWSLGLWYLQTFHFSLSCFRLSLFFSPESSHTLVLSKRYLIHE